MAVAPSRARMAAQHAEDAIAFFARAAVLRHCASVAAGAGALDEAERLTALASEAESVVGQVITRIVGQVRTVMASSSSSSSSAPAPASWPKLPRS